MQDADNSTPHRKRVRIDPTSKVVATSRASFSEQEQNDSWWTAMEFAESKETVKRQCKGFRLERRYSDTLTKAYDMARGMAVLQQSPTGGQKGEEDTALPHVSNTLHLAVENSWNHSEKHDVSHFNAQCILSFGVFFPIAYTYTNQGSALKEWYRDNGPRGLEGYSSRLHALRRQRHLHDARQAVFLEQSRQRLNNQKDEGKIAKDYQMVSRNARTFARLMGHADAWAAACHSEEESSVSSRGTLTTSDRVTNIDSVDDSAASARKDLISDSKGTPG